LLQYFPEEIESDLVVRGIEIADWWNRNRGDAGHLKLSSRRLLIVLRNLPDDSSFKNAMREDWSEDKYIQVGILNEARLMRADNAAFEQVEMEPMLIKSPKQQEAEQADAEAKLALRAGIMEQLKAGSP